MLFEWHAKDLAKDASKYIYLPATRGCSNLVTHDTTVKLVQGSSISSLDREYDDENNVKQNHRLLEIV